MKRFGALLIALAVLVGEALAQPTTQIIEIISDGVVRRAMVVHSEFGTRRRNESPRPLVFVFHGRTGAMEGIAKRMAIHEHWHEAIVVYPQGLWVEGGLFDGNGWVLPTASDEGRDIRFFDALLREIRKRYRVDEERIYATGHSNGSGFTHSLWALRGELFAAFAPSASGAARLGDLVNRQPVKPAIFIAAENDELIPIAAVRRCIERTVARNGCGEPQHKTKHLTLYPSASGCDVETYIHNYGHRFSPTALPHIVRFFQRHTKTAK